MEFLRSLKVFIFVNLGSESVLFSVLRHSMKLFEEIFEKLLKRMFNKFSSSSSGSKDSSNYIWSQNVNEKKMAW